MRAIVGGHDVLSVMPTGAGKSICYQLAAMLLEGTTLVISPLIALMKDQVESLPPPIARQATFINSQLDPREAQRREAAVRDGTFKLVYAAPERLRSWPFLDALRAARVGMVAIDEAHCIALWGHDFRPDYLFASEALRMLGAPRVLAMTATATPAIQHEIGQSLGRELQVLAMGVVRPNLRLSVEHAANRDQKIARLTTLCTQLDGSGIVYVRSRADADGLATHLAANGVQAASYHAGLGRGVRDSVQDRFMLDRLRVVVATTAFGMGVDKRAVRFVIHFSPPDSLEAYSQEAGRAGRDGLESSCILLATPGDQSQLVRWKKQSRVDVEDLRAAYRELQRQARDRFVIQARPRADAADPTVAESSDTTLRASISMLERAGLVRRHLDLPRDVRVRRRSDQFPLDHGEWHSLDAARELGVSPPDLEPRLRERARAGQVDIAFGPREMLVELLETPRDVSLTIDRLLDRWDRAQDDRIENLFGYIRGRRCRHEMLATHFGQADVGRCGSCDNCRVTIIALPAATTEPADLAAAHDELFARLRAWRRERARNDAVPPYVVFHDATIREIADRRPRTRAQLARVPGLGPVKLERYGEDVLAIINQSAD